MSSTMDRTRTVQLVLAFFVCSVFLTSLSISCLRLYADAMIFGTVGMEAIVVAIIPGAVATLAVVLSCGQAFCIAYRYKRRGTRTWFCLLINVYVLSGLVAISFGCIVFSSVLLLEVIAFHPGDSLGLLNHTSTGFLNVLLEISVFRMSDVMLGVYTSCCDQDIIGPCQEVIITHGNTFCYRNRVNYEVGLRALPEFTDLELDEDEITLISFCFNLEVTLEEVCPGNRTGDYSHDIPEFLEAIYRKIAPHYSFVGIASMTLGITTILLVAAFCVINRKGPVVPKMLAESAERIQYGTPIKEANGDITLV